MDKEIIKELLDAEDQANKLIQELSRLKSEVESYREASRGLRDTSDGLSRLTDALTTITEGIGKVVETTKNLGTPQIINRQDLLDASLKEAEERLNQKINILVTSENLGSRVEEIRTELGSLATSTDVNGLDQKLEQATAQLQDQTATMQSEFKERFDQLEKSDKSLRILLISGFFITLVGFGVFAMLILSKIS